MTETLSIIERKIAGVAGGSDQYTYLEHLSPGLQMVYATRHLEHAVRRSGFEQYLSRVGGHLAVKAMQGYELIGAECHAALVEDALAEFLARAPSSSAYALLDDVFKDLDSPGPLKLEYIEAHPEEFMSR